jgi:hypothetical protein
LTNKNIYLSQVSQTLPRLLSLFDADQTSDSYGMGDRYHWAWGLIDFGNGSYQGAANGLAHLWKNGLWNYPTEKNIFLTRIDSLFTAAKKLTYKDGSLEEAFPHEGSYCVTALVAFDLLCAAGLLQDEVEKDMYVKWLAIIEPMIGYLIKADETHAMISNHLATAVAALVRWKKQTNEDKGEKKAKELMDRILCHQSVEGWFKEYDGADPGYQTLCTYYLADVHVNRPDYQLLEPLRRSVQFVWHFAHPDGSFGGIYGSRSTRFYFPAGFELLSREIPEARALSLYMLESIQQNTVVGLTSMDESNLIPMFNAYCRAAAEHASYADGNLPVIPFKRLQQQVGFPGAGIFVNGGDGFYSIINVNKGGVVMHFRDNKLAVHDVGVAVKNTSGKYGSSQTFTIDNNTEITDQHITVTAAIGPMPKQLPTPFQFLVLRVLGMTMFRFSSLREWFKRVLVKLLITKKKVWPASNTRRIEFGYDLTITDSVKMPAGYSLVKDPGCFVSIHMASQGYWQIQDEIK